MAWMFVPYAVMEAGYVAAASVLPVREHVQSLSLALLGRMVFWKPIGPYWYLHTLMLCSAAYYCVYRLASRWNAAALAGLLGPLYWALSDGLRLMGMGNALYFLVGVWIRRSGLGFSRVFQASLWSWLPFCLLCGSASNLERYSLPGMAVTFFSMSAFLGTCRLLPEKAGRTLRFIGANTLPVLLFSPIFTILSKLFLPLFAFDPTGLCFAAAAVSFAVSGSLSIAWVMDKWHLSLRFCGRRLLCLPDPAEWDLPSAPPRPGAPA